MEYWTLLVITALNGQPVDFDGMQSFVLFPSEATCAKASQQISDALPYDHKVECIRTATPSKSPRPLPKPERKS